MPREEEIIDMEIKSMQVSMQIDYVITIQFLLAQSTNNIIVIIRTIIINIIIDIIII